MTPALDGNVPSPCPFALALVSPPLPSAFSGVPHHVPLPSAGCPLCPPVPHWDVPVRGAEGPRVLPQGDIGAELLLQELCVQPCPLLGTAPGMPWWQRRRRGALPAPPSSPGSADGIQMVIRG